MMSVVSDIGIDSVKTGMMYSEETIRGVVECLEELWTVEDHPPVSHGLLFWRVGRSYDMLLTL